MNQLASKAFDPRWRNLRLGRISTAMALVPALAHGASAKTLIFGTVKNAAE